MRFADYSDVAPKRRPPGRPRKTALDLSLKLNEKQRYWLDYLADKGFRGNGAEEVALRLLDEKFRELYETKALPDAFIEPVRGESSSQQNISITKSKSKSKEESSHD